MPLAKFGGETLGESLGRFIAPEDRATMRMIDGAIDARRRRIAAERAATPEAAREIHARWDGEWKLAVRRFERAERARMAREEAAKAAKQARKRK